jgi:hypothetical protein
LRIRIRFWLAVTIIGLGLLIGGTVIPGETATTTRPANLIQPDIYFLIPTSDSIGVSTLNGTATLVVAQMTGDLASLPPIVNVSVFQKDVVSFSVPNREYYEIEFLGSNGSQVAETYTLSEGGQPSDVLLSGGVLSIAGFAGMFLFAIAGRQSVRPNSTGRREETNMRGDGSAFSRKRRSWSHIGF